MKLIYEPGMQFHWISASKFHTNSISVTCVPTGWLVRYYGEDDHVVLRETLIPDKDHVTNPRAFWDDYHWGPPSDFSGDEGTTQAVVEAHWEAIRFKLTGEE